MSYNHEFDLKVSIERLMNSTNVMEFMEDDDIRHIGQCCKEGFEQDIRSREEWDQRTAEGMKLALQILTPKTEPWPGCANVKFPLITVAALQYHARAYPALIDTNDLVKVRVFGVDRDGSKTARAQRISTHMTWQNVKQDREWEEVHDKAYLIQPIVGSVFIKTVYDPAKRRKSTKLVLPKNFVINYWTRSIENSQRYTETFELTDNDIRQRELDGRFMAPSDWDDGAPEIPKTDNTDTSELQTAQDERQGMQKPPESSVTPFNTGEQYCWLDLDGDGYKEPYIVTFDIGTGTVRRIVARFNSAGIRRIKGGRNDGEIYEICPIQFYTKIPFIPSPDGGFYDLGLDTLCGPINESVNTAFNQTFDGATMATLGGGFIARGAGPRGGPFSMRPYEFHQVDKMGDDIRKNIMLAPVREPSQVLFQVIQFLVQYAERIISATDVQMGENVGQNTKVGTVEILNENGARVYSAIYKRTWRALGEEFCLQYDINRLYFEYDEDYIDLTRGEGAMISPMDYDEYDVDILPAADPNVVSDSQRQQQNLMLVQLAQTMPGFNRYELQKRLLLSMKVPDIERVMPQPMGQDGRPAPDFAPPPNPKMLEIQIKEGKLQLEMATFQAEQMEKKVRIMGEVQKTQAEIVELYARADKHMAEAGAARSDPAIKLIYAQIEAAGQRQNFLLGLIDSVIDAKSAEKEAIEGESKKEAEMGEVASGFSAPPAVTNAEGLGMLQ